jgi:hypothetical protein
MTNDTKLHHAKCLRKARRFFRFTGELVETSERLFVLVPDLRSCGQPNLRNIVSTVTLFDLRVKVGTRDEPVLWRDSQDY